MSFKHTRLICGLTEKGLPLHYKSKEGISMKSKKKQKDIKLKIKGDFNEVLRLAVSDNPKSKQTNKNREKGAKSMNDTWEFYKDSKNEWRWRRIASNGRIVGSSSEGYKSRQHCVENARRNGYNGS